VASALPSVPTATLPAASGVAVTFAREVESAMALVFPGVSSAFAFEMVMAWPTMVPLGPPASIPVLCEIEIDMLICGVVIVLLAELDSALARPPEFPVVTEAVLPALLAVVASAAWAMLTPDGRPSTLTESRRSATMAH
jgi:hypothetical protein